MLKSHTRKDTKQRGKMPGNQYEVWISVRFLIKMERSEAPSAEKGCAAFVKIATDCHFFQSCLCVQACCVADVLALSPERTGCAFLQLRSADCLRRTNAPSSPCEARSAFPRCLPVLPPGFFRRVSNPPFQERQPTIHSFQTDQMGSSCASSRRGSSSSDATTRAAADSLPEVPPRMCAPLLLSSPRAFNPRAPVWFHTRDSLILSQWNSSHVSEFF